MKHAAVFLAVVVMLAATAAQTKRHDALNEADIDQLRETAQEPEKRLPLMVDFARARLAAIEQLRADPRFADGRGQRVHDMLADFGQIVDELGDNMDEYDRQNYDLRKPLKTIIEAASEFQLKLRTLKDSSASGQGAREARAYEFVLQDVTESVNTTLDDAHKMLEDQERRVKEAKEAEKRKKK